MSHSTGLSNVVEGPSISVSLHLDSGDGLVMVVVVVMAVSEFVKLHVPWPHLRIY